MGIMTRQQDDAFVITSDRAFGSSPTTRAPPGRPRSTRSGPGPAGRRRAKKQSASNRSTRPTNMSARTTRKSPARSSNGSRTLGSRPFRAYSSDLLVKSAAKLCTTIIVASQTINSYSVGRGGSRLLRSTVSRSGLASGALTLNAKNLSIVAAACVGLGCSVLVVAVAKPPVEPPIALGYRDTPIFMDAHESNVAAIAFSADGKTLATGSGSLRLWDAATGRLRSIHSDDATRGVAGIAFSPDSRSIAVVGGLFVKEAELWDTASGRIVQEFAEPAGAGPAAPFTYRGKPTDFRIRTGVAYSPDGRILATAPDGVVLREIASGNILATLNQPAKGVKAIAFSPDGKLLATAAEDKKVRLWSIPEGKLQATLEGPTQPLSSVAFSPDGQRIAAAGSGKRSILSRDETPVGFLWSWGPLDASAEFKHLRGPDRKIELGNVQVRQAAFVDATTVVVGAGRDLLSFDLQAEGPIRA